MAPCMFKSNGILEVSKILLIMRTTCVSIWTLEVYSVNYQVNIGTLSDDTPRCT